MAGFELFLKAVYDALKSDAQLTAAVKEIYDAVPEDEKPTNDSKFPYIVISSFVCTSFNTDTKRGVEGTLYVNVYSRKHGKKEAATIASLLYKALDKKDLIFNGFEFLSCDFSGLRAEGISKEKTYRALCEFDILYRQA